jgi:hypothetical protein
MSSITLWAQEKSQSMSTNAEGSITLDHSSKMDFEAHRVGSNIELKWTVSGMVKYFSVERSLDKDSWEPILNMTGSNQTVNKTEYFDIDYDVPSVKLFYRINYVMFSGESVTSNASFVPAYDDLSMFEERLIKTIYDPIRVGAKLNLFFVNFKSEDLLLVLRDQCSQEFYAKVKYLPKEDTYLVTNVSGDIPSGQYLITASSKQHIYSSKLRIELTQ